MSDSQARIDAGASGRWSGYLTKDDGTRVGAANLTALTASLTNAATGTALNSRTAQDILGAGAGTNDFDITDDTVSIGGVDTLVTVLGWHVQDADTDLEVTSADVDAESHPCLIEGTYTDGSEAKKLEHTHRLECIDTVGVCTYQDVVGWMNDVSEDQDRTFVEFLIRALTRRIERVAKRKLRKNTTDTAEVFSPGNFERYLYLARYPVDSVASIKEDVNGDFSAATAVDTDSYYVNNDRGIIEFRRRAVVAGKGSVQVTYKGGMYRESGACPEDLRMAAALQVAFAWGRRGQPGVRAISAGGSSSTIFLEKDWLAELKHEVDLLKRVELEI